MLAKRPVAGASTSEAESSDDPGKSTNMINVQDSDGEVLNNEVPNNEAPSANLEVVIRKK